MRNRGWRQRQRYVKGMRRVREDRAQHATGTTCPCFGDDVSKGRGVVFSFFADNPKLCSDWCCGNPRRHKGSERLTRQERRAPTTTDWES